MVADESIVKPGNKSAAEIGEEKSLMRKVKVVVNGKPFEVEVGDLNTSPVSVTVNGKPFNVEMQLDEGGAAPLPVAPPVAAQAAPVYVKPAAPVAVVGSADEVRAPMPGKILTVHVKAGDQVTRGKPLVALEAMKMRNEIRAPRDGVVASVDVTEGQKVTNGDLLVKLG